MSWWKRTQAANPPADEDTVELPPAADDASPAPKASAQHPVLVAALAAGVTTAAEFADMLATARAAREDLQASCLKEAVRCFGQDAAPAKAKALEGQSYADAKAVRDIWRETADAKYGVTEDKGAKPQTAPVQRAEGDDGRNPAAAAAIPQFDMNKIYDERAKQGG